MPCRYDSSLPLLSIHVPKTGGTTVRETLQSTFGEQFFLHYVDESERRAPRSHRLSGGSCIHGHFNRFRGYGVDDYYPQVSQFITFLRDPFEQHVSLFFYLRREADAYHFQGQVSPIATFNGFEEFMSYVANNRQVIQTTFANTLLAHMPARFAPCDPSRMFNEGFVHMGTTDVMVASLHLLGVKLGKPVTLIQPQNVSPRDLSVDPRLRRQHEMLFPEEHDFFGEVQSRHAEELRLAGY